MHLPPDAQTNVSDLRIGAGAIKGIGQEVGRYVVVTMDIPWEITRNKIGGTPEAVVLIDSIEQAYLDQRLEALPPCDTILGIGGGQAIDAGKYFAWKRSLRMVNIPTILSVNAFVTPAAGIRVKHDVRYVGAVSPDPLIVDFDCIKTAPATLNIAGIGDLLSMHTASFDWTHAHRMGKSEYPFSQEAVDAGQAILDELFGVLGEIRSLSERGMRAIVEGYMALNAICLPRDHYRVEEGSEHYLFYELEERLERPFIHGHIIGMGIYLMSRLQGNKPDHITSVMDEVGLEYHPKHLAISRQSLTASMLNLKAFVKSKEQLWYTYINDAEITPGWVEEALDGLSF